MIDKTSHEKLVFLLGMTRGKVCWAVLLDGPKAGLLRRALGFWQLRSHHSWRVQGSQLCRAKMMFTWACYGLLPYVGRIVFWSKGPNKFESLVSSFDEQLGNLSESLACWRHVPSAGGFWWPPKTQSCCRFWGMYLEFRSSGTGQGLVGMMCEEAT